MLIESEPSWVLLIRFINIVVENSNIKCLEIVIVNVENINDMKLKKSIPNLQLNVLHWTSRPLELEFAICLFNKFFPL